MITPYRTNALVEEQKRWGVTRWRKRLVRFLRAIPTSIARERWLNAEARKPGPHEDLFMMLRAAGEEERAVKRRVQQQEQEKLDTLMNVQKQIALIQARLDQQDRGLVLTDQGLVFTEEKK